MPSVETRLAFARKHWTTKEGKPFSTRGRDWVVGEFWKPATGFKLWPRDLARLCPLCTGQANTIADYNLDHPEGCANGDATCCGLSQEPIIITILNLPRRSGKTFNALAFSAASILTSKNESITYVASAKDQTDQLFDENMRVPINASEVLTNLCHIADNKVTVEKTKSRFECVSTSHRSITGRGRTLIIIDEARDVPAQVAAALLPSIFDHSGWECPLGHVHHEGKPKSLICSVCGKALQPWFARVVIESSSGIVEDNERDWFGELVEQTLATPHKNVHLYTTQETINPRVSKTTVKAIEEVFGGLETTRAYIDIEVNNTPRRRGEDFMRAIDLDRVMGPTEDLGSSTDKCVAFLDTSLTVDTTSLVVLGTKDGWATLYTMRLDTWIPSKMPNGVINEAVIIDHLDRVIPMFPNLVTFGVDTRIMPWAKAMVVNLRQSKRGWSRKVDAYNGGREERDTAWNLLEQRILSQTIRLPDNKALRQELLGLQRHKRANGTIEIKDRKRTQTHADISEALAECCRRAYLEQSRQRVGLSATLGVARATRGGGGYAPRMTTL